MGKCRLPFRRSSSKLCATLDLSRGLRVDERKLPKAVSGISGPVGTEQGAQSGAASTLVFFGDPWRVGEGFVNALRAMGMGATMADVVAQNPSERENDHA